MRSIWHYAGRIGSVGEDLFELGHHYCWNKALLALVVAFCTTIGGVTTPNPSYIHFARSLEEYETGSQEESVGMGMGIPA